MIRDHVAGRLSALDAEMAASIPPGGNWRSIPTTIPSTRLAQIRESQAAGLGSRSTYYGRLRWDRPSYTISTYFNRPGNGAFLHPDLPRLITIREGARLQTFPDTFDFVGPLRSRYLQVGNAVPPVLSWQLASVLDQGTVVDLFAGAGGLSLGFGWAGHDVVLAADVDPFMIAAISKNDPLVREPVVADLGDASTLGRIVSRVRARAGHERVGIVVGGPPCQGFSTAGNHQVDDPRNRLVHAFLDAVETLQPWRVLFENVPALGFRRHVGTLNAIQQRLQSLGYSTDIVLACAESYGVPQLRRRLLLQAARHGLPIVWPAGWIRSLATSQTGSPPRLPQEQLGEPLTVADAISDLPQMTADSADDPVSYGSAANSRLQRWARGQISIQELVGHPRAMPPDAIPLFGST